ncbi:MAG: uracil-DNA glycosylase [Caulobacterales bacterium]
MADREQAARALLAFWEQAGVDVGEARAILRAPLPVAPAPPRERPAEVVPVARAPKVAVGPAAPVVLAQQMAAKAQSIPDLAAAIAAFDGCALKKGAKKTVVYDGVVGAPVLVIGEAPGADEDSAGMPFVGRAGQLLDRMLAAVNLSRQSNVLISNAIFWRPPGNRTPTTEELAICRPFVERMIGLARPKVLVLAGGAAASSVLDRSEGVTRLRGQRLTHMVAGLTTPVNVMVMLHPAYLLRQPVQKRLAWADLLMLDAWLAELGGG